MFQQQDGVDILLLAMFVTEYVLTESGTSPSSSAGRVVINYLDTVQYFEPRK